MLLNDTCSSSSNAKRKTDPHNSYVCRSSSKQCNQLSSKSTCRFHCHCGAVIASPLSPSSSREGVPPFFGKPNTHNMCQNNTIAIMPTNNNNTDNNKGKEVEKQANRRSRGSVGREILLETLSLLMERRTD